MTSQDARTHYNFLMTLCLRREESFGPLALTFLKENDLDQLGLTPEEQFNLYMATSDAFAAEPKRYTHKLECLQRAQHLLPRTRYDDPELIRLLSQQIQKTSAELEIYNEAMRSTRAKPAGPAPEKHRLIIESELPEYFLDIAQRRAGEYYQNKFRVPKDIKTAQHFGATTRKFEPDNPIVQKEVEGACAPFMAARTGAFHVMMPFDIKISRKPEDPLEAGVRIFYMKTGYSFALRYELGRLCGYQDGKVLDIALEDPHLIFVSFSPVKDQELLAMTPPPPSGSTPVELQFPMGVLENIGSLGTYVQVICNLRIWFDASAVSLLIQGAPDLNEYGLKGGAGLMTRTYASDKVSSYVENLSKPWQEGLSFNFANLHLALLPGVDTAFIPYNTPIFSLFPVLSRQTYKIEDRRAMDAK
ncbi:MAG: hypothetical protein ACREI3_08220 [Nitrospirales bacterium]